MGRDTNSYGLTPFGNGVLKYLIVTAGCRDVVTRIENTGAERYKS